MTERQEARPDPIALSLYNSEGEFYTVAIDSLTVGQRATTFSDGWFIRMTENDMAGQVGDIMLDDFSFPLSFVGASLSLSDRDKSLFPGGQTDTLVAFGNQFSQGSDVSNLDMSWFGGIPPGQFEPGSEANFFISGGIRKNSIQSTAVVPVPAAIWLFGSGILGLAGVSLRKKD